ncbi:MAG: gamma-glutamyltransferase [Pseudomonadota bacterium]|uniref:gamma-glutamyltransferase n=1 Tax=Roseovarius TaxID=74030 RepID=UPI0022A86D7B|nr:gamma-glutamyltransferase [Roseovarius sp. EGI FJ00037]MCZ0814029.1 gamma-glutamyltransferase [Roseovarius sp. EGI FJ00037]
MRTILTAFAAAMLFSGALWAQQATDSVAPEGAGVGSAASVPASSEVAAAEAAKAAGRPVEAQDWMVSVANPLAAEAGARVLRAGGTAADAMVAVQAVLGLVEPQSSGLGGGAFLVWRDGGTGEITTLDGRETAPLAATPRLFQDATGEPMQFYDAVVGGRSVGVPGTPALMEAAHERWGRADWAGLFDDAIALAEEGFAVSPRLSIMAAGDALRLSRFGPTRDYFLSDNSLLEVGERLRNPEYAETLRSLASDGAVAFYSGEIARDIVATVRGAQGNPGVMTETDLAIYRVKERAPVCIAYRAYEVCGMGPPSSGGLTVGQILGMLEPFDLGAMGPGSPEAWRLIGDASRLAFADRGRYMADDDFVPIPVKGLIAKDYLERRSQVLRGDDALPEVAPGQPAFDHALDLADDESIEFPSTSHISLTDRYGNALSMTTTIENAFGSRLMVRGFLLNNELTDFSFRSHEDGVPVANRVEPGKRPRSSMAPTIVLKDGAPVLIVGSPGGSRIIGYVVKAIIAHLDWKMDVQQAVSLPNMVNRFGVFDVEAGRVSPRLAARLEALGYEVSARPLVSGLQAIAIGATLRGGADPRREGIALGE